MSMFGQTMAAGPSLADIAAVTGNRNNDGFGGDGWWAWIILAMLFGGYGNGFGYGGNGGQGAYDTQAVVQRGFDTQAIISKLDGINSGICSLGYDQLAQMNGINTNVMQTGFGIMNALNQGFQMLNAQQADCCCKTQTGFLNVVNQMDKDTCSINTNVHQTGDAIIQNQNQGFQMLNNTIKDGFCNLEMREAQREIADLRQRLNDCNRDNALQGTANYIINTVRPTPGPAWVVQNPWSGCNNGWNSWNNSCGGNSCCA